MPALTSPHNKALALRGANLAANPLLAGAFLYEGEERVMLAVPGLVPVEVSTRVVRSNRTGLLDFYYRLALPVADYDDALRLSVTFLSPGPIALSFADFRTDAPGVLPPNYFESSPTESLAFRFEYGLSVGRKSRWCFVSTNAREFRENGGVLKLITGKRNVTFPVPGPGVLAAVMPPPGETEAETAPVAADGSTTRENKDPAADS